MFVQGAGEVRADHIAWEHEEGGHQNNIPRTWKKCCISLRSCRLCSMHVFRTGLMICIHSVTTSCFRFLPSATAFMSSSILARNSGRASLMLKPALFTSQTTPATGGQGGATALGYSALNIGAGFAGNYVGQQVFGGDTTGIGSGVGGAIGSIWGPIGTAIGSFLGEGLETALGNIKTAN